MRTSPPTRLSPDAHRSETGTPHAARGRGSGGPAGTGWLAALGRRLHFYAAILVGPFILIAAVSGALYAMTPQLERVIYSDELTAPVSAQNVSLGEQVLAAQEHLGDQGATLTAVRPAPASGETTRVMFNQEGLGPSESRAVFIDPGTAQVRGDLTVYGTGGTLPLRTWIDYLHRGLHLGDAGRLYSELAASWLGIVVLAGLGLWIGRWRRNRRRRRDLLVPGRRYSGYRRLLNWHAPLGLVLVLGALFLSASGITWSQHAGANVTALRDAFSWQTPVVSTGLDAHGSGTAADREHTEHTEHAAEDLDEAHGDHGGAEGLDSPVVTDPALFDDVLDAGRQVNIDAGLIQISPGAPGEAWVINEFQRSFPTQYDSVAIDPQTLQVVDRVDFADFPMMAKLARWGVDLHMGVMFGVPNQIVLVGLALGIAAMVVLGYAMWWARRPTRGFAGAPAPSAIRDAPWWGRALIIVGALAIGIWLPLVGVTLAGFVVLDVLVQWRAHRPMASRWFAPSRPGRGPGPGPAPRGARGPQRPLPRLGGRAR